MSARMRLRRADGAVYLDRWGIECRFGGAFLHKMAATDPGIDLHSHPWWFTSLIIWGGYTEERATENRASAIAAWAEGVGMERRGAPRRRRWLSLQSTPLGYAHRITELRRRTSWSLVLHGPKVRTWGFFLPTGWVDWMTYEDTVRAERRDMWAEISNDDRPKTRYARERSS